jgi:serine/threonine protein kinase
MDQLDKKAVWPGWETLRLIGRGSYGAVYEIERDMLGEKEKAALKLITIPQNNSDIEQLFDEGYDEASVTDTFHEHLKSIVSEYSLMRKLNGSSNVVNCDDVRYVQHEDGFGWDIFIKMELLTPLAKALGKQVTDEQVMRVGADISRALVLCKKHNIIHRDIKPANIFVSETGDYKLGDFGIAKTVEKTSGGTKIGTYEYMAPEVYRDQPYGSGVDIYSLGMVLYWLLNERRMPFLPLPPTSPTNSEKEKARRRRFSGEAIPAPAHGSEKLQRIVLKAVAYDPEERYQSAEEMLSDLETLRWQRSFSFESAPAPAPRKPEPAAFTPPAPPVQPAPPVEEKDEDTVPPPVGFGSWPKPSAPARPEPSADTEKEGPAPAPAPKEPEPAVPALPVEEKDEDTVPPPVGFASWLKQPAPTKPEPPAETEKEEPAPAYAPWQPEPVFPAEPSLPADEGTASGFRAPRPSAAEHPRPDVPGTADSPADEGTVSGFRAPRPSAAEHLRPAAPGTAALPADEGTVGGFRAPRPSAANHPAPAAPFGSTGGGNTFPAPAAPAPWQPRPAAPASAGGGNSFPSPEPWQPAPPAPAPADTPVDEGTVGAFRMPRAPRAGQPGPAIPAEPDPLAEEGTVGAFRMPRAPKAGQPKPGIPAEPDPLADEGTVGAFRMPKAPANRQSGPERPNYITAQGAYRPATPWQQGQSGQTRPAAPGNGHPGQPPVQRPQENLSWQCECGCRTKLPYCPNCYRPRPAQLPPQPPVQRPKEALSWQCECGCRTQLPYCPNCYRPRPAQPGAPAPAVVPPPQSKKEKKAKKAPVWGKQPAPVPQPAAEEGTWRCVCGARNRIGARFCSACDMPAPRVFSGGGEKENGR